MKRPMGFVCSILMGILPVVFLAGDVQKIEAVKSEAVENGGRPSQWINSSINCDPDKDTALQNAMGNVRGQCLVISGGQGTITIWSEPSCQYNLETNEWCCTIGGSCYWP